MPQLYLETTQKELIELAARTYGVAVSNVKIKEESYEDQILAVAREAQQWPNSTRITLIRAVKDFTGWNLADSKHFLDEKIPR
jgi:predicted YcjX-like family ATPase